MKLSSISMTSSSISVPLSILDLAQIPEGGNAQTALHRSRELAQHAERLGYHRFWLAEHHNMAGIASAATSVAIGFVAEGTSTIRVGRRRGDAPQPRAARDRGAVRDARGALPGPDRPRARPRARHRPADDARAAPGLHERGHVPAGRPGAAGAARRPGARPAHPGRARARARTSRCGSSARRCSAPSSPPRSGCRTRSRRTSRPPRSSRRSRSTASASSLPRSSTSRT